MSQPENQDTAVEKMIGRVARSIYLWSRDAGCLPPPWADVPERHKQTLREQAVAAVATHLSALLDAGYVVVPLVPTQEMQKAYFDSIDKFMHRVENDMCFGRFDNHRIAYRAMLAVRPLAVQVVAKTEEKDEA